jgi:hypothetical protein
MNRRQLVERLRAAGLHFIATLAVTLVAAAIIFWVWFPSPFAEMLGGFKLFALIAVCDLVLGPLISLVIYNTRKPARELVTDYMVIGCVQLAALGYGMWVVAQTRPVVVSYTAGRVDVVQASQIADADLKAAKAPYNSLSWTGPIQVLTVLPTDQKLVLEITETAVAGGRDFHNVPSLYRPYAEAVTEVIRAAKPIDKLLEKAGKDKAIVDAAMTKLGKSASDVRWLHVKHRTGFWVALVDAKTAEILAYLPLDVN